VKVLLLDDAEMLKSIKRKVLYSST